MSKFNKRVFLWLPLIIAALILGILTPSFTSMGDELAPVITGAASSFGFNTATISGTLNSLGNASTSVYFNYGLSANPYSNSTTSQNMTGLGNFSANITGLASNTIYHYRANAVIDGVSVNGSDATFILPTFELTADVNGDLPDLQPYCYTSPIKITVNAIGRGYPGHLSQYHIDYDWGDGIKNTIDVSSITGDYLTQDASKYFRIHDFVYPASGHSYAASGPHTVTVTLYHSQFPGGDKADPMVETIPIITAPVITGYVYNDLNQNGVQDAGEPGISGVSVNLTGPGSLSLATTTNSKGLYYFYDGVVGGFVDPLPNGTYQVTETDPGGYFSVNPLNNDITVNITGPNKYSGENFGDHLNYQPLITWNNPADIVYGTALSDAQLNASAKDPNAGADLPGSFAYTPAAGEILNASANQTLSVSFTPADTAHFSTVTAVAHLNVVKADQTVAWNNPAGITYGAPLTGAQLNAIVSVAGPDMVAGALTYTPAAGTVLNAGNGQNLSVTAAETANYKAATKTVSIDVARANLTVTPDDKTKSYGQTFTEFTGSISGLQNSDNIAVLFGSAGADAAATLAGSPYDITATLIDPLGRLANYNSTLNTGKLTVVKADQTITFNALPDKGFGDADFAVTATASSGLPVTFSASGNCSISDNVVHLTGGGVCTITAQQSGDGNYNAAPEVAQSFAIKYRITATAGENGAITPSGDVLVDPGADQTFEITPNHYYHTADISVDGTSIGALTQSTSYTFHAVNGNHTIQATFAIDTFNVTVSIQGNGHGTVTLDPASGIVAYGGSASLTISPDAGCHVSYYDNGSPVKENSASVESYTINPVCRDHAVVVQFNNFFTITATQGANGAIAPSGAVIVIQGADQTFAISPDAHYHVADVQVDGNSVGAVSSYTFSAVNRDHTINASFSMDTFTIRVDAGPNGTVSPSTAQTVDYGATPTFNIAASTGYHVASVTVDGSAVTLTDGAYTFPAVSADHTLSATFAIDTFTITVNAGPGGSISPAGPDVAVNYGADQSFVITPNSGYTIAGVTKDGVSVGAVASVTFTNITANHSVAASFTVSNSGGGGGGGGGWTPSTTPTPTPTPTTEPTPTPIPVPVQTSSIPSPEPTPTVTPAPVVEYLTVDFSGQVTQGPISSSGALVNTLIARSADGANSLEIPQDTVILDQNGKVVKQIQVKTTQMPPLPEGQVAVGSAYDFQPSTVTFSQPVIITLGYNADQLPKKIQSIGMAYYQDGSGWVALSSEGGTVASAGKVSAATNHFTIFALVADHTPAVFKLDKLVITPSVESGILNFMVRTGQAATISANLLNDGGMRGACKGELKLNGNLVADQSVSVEPGLNQQLTFNISGLGTGKYTVQVSGPSGSSVSGEFNSTLWINWWLIVGLVLAVAALIWLFIIFRQRRHAKSKAN